MPSLLVLPPLALSFTGSALLLWAARLMRRRAAARDPAPPQPAPAISLLKPLHGAEPQLRANLASALNEDYPGAIEMICGVARADDPAAAVARALPVRLVIDPRPWGSNAKVSNLANIAVAATHDILVLADSDMAVPRDYCARLTGALAEPGIGAVTCLYVGRGDTGFWSRLVAAGIDSHFVPASEIGLATGLGHPCMGSTIALRRETLEAIGGFAAFADTLADDHAIGAAVRATGARVAVPAMVLVHGCAETSFAALVRQELRWAATIAGIDPAGHAGSIVLHPLPLAILGWLIGGGTAGAAAVLLALVARAAVSLAAARLDFAGRNARQRLAGLALIPLRDLLSFGLFVASFAVRSVDWRGTSLNLGRDGALSPRKDQGL